jgi:hypothetical protein
MKHDRRGDDGAGQAAAPHFVDAGDVHEPDAPQRVLERAHRRDAGHTKLKTENLKLKSGIQPDLKRGLNLDFQVLTFKF